MTLNPIYQQPCSQNTDIIQAGITLDTVTSSLFKTCQLVCFIVFISKRHKTNKILILLILDAIFAPYSFQKQFEKAKYSLFESAVCKQKPIPTVLTSKSFMLLLTAMMPLLGNYPPTDVFSVL